MKSVLQEQQQEKFCLKTQTDIILQQNSTAD